MPSLGKPKALQNHTKHAQSKRQHPESVEDFQEAADYEEETGGKWRAGDQAKSSRAFMRAIELYNNGLARHPKSFDLAYNKARLELELSEQPSLVAKLSISLMDLLRQALASHRYALRINNGESVDILFNTAQVMVSLAENIGETSRQHSDEAVALLHEALELLNACFTRQEMLLEEQNQSFGGDGDGGVKLDSSQGGRDTTVSAPYATDKEEQMVTIETPVTASELLDTARASLTTITLLASLDDESGLSTLASMAQALSETRIPQIVAMLTTEEQTTVNDDIALERASLVSALATAEYKANRISELTFQSRLQVFEPLNLTARFADMSTYADALVEFATTILTSNSQQEDLAQAVWATLTKAQDLYGRASKLDSAEARDRKAQIFESRGDVEMLRYRLVIARFEELAANITSSAPLLIKNAETYYRGSVTLFRNAGDEEAAAKAVVRNMVAAKARAMDQDRASNELLEETSRKGSVATSVIGDMVAEGLLDDSWPHAVFGQY